MRSARVLPLLLLVLAATATRAQAQAEQQSSLEEFVQQVAWLWSMGDVAALVDLLPSDERIVLDTGSGTETVHPRHAAAALRALFDARETAGARALRANFSGGDPPRGFGEIAWTFRPRGAPSDQTRTVYVGTTTEGAVWRMNEIRVMR